MKQKKRSGFFRIGALLLVFILAVNLVMPCFAAGGVVFDDTKTIDTGILEYDYDQIPEYMLEDNYALDALEYIGFDVQALKDNKVLYNQDYTGRHLAGNQYLLQEDPILTYIKYNDQGAYGSSSKKAETAEEIAASQTGRVPNIDVFYNGNDTFKPGMSCTSFVEYFVFGYLKHIVGKDVGYIETMHATALKRLADGTRTYPDTWTEMCEGQGGLISQGKVKHFSIELDESKDQTAEYNAIWRKISPGTIIRFGNDTSEYIHYAVYIGTYNNIHYVAHVGNDRGPEIFIAEHMAANNGPKSSLPIDFYDFRFKDPYGAIQVVKSDADDGTKLAGAVFKVVNQTTQKVYTFGPTNEKGYAIVEYLPYNATSGTKYTVQEVVAPEGYALDPTIHTVTLSDDTPLITLYQEIVNEKSYGSLQIIKNTNTGNNKAGWQFNVYKNSPVYTTALSLDNSGQMFRVTVSDSNGNSVTSDAVSMTTTPLKILLQPSNVSVAVGEAISYTVAAQGDGISYQWQYKNPGDDWITSTSTDGLSPNYTYTMRADRDGRLSRCIITDKYGNTVTTDEVFMVLPTTLAVVTDPEDTTTAVGQTVTMAITASGSNVSYQWQYSTNGGTTWTNCTTSNHSGCTGATSNTLRFTGNAAYDGRMYRCKITDGSTTEYSEAATSNIVASIINTQPQTQIAELGDSVTFSIGATGTNLTYTWQGKTRGSNTWTTLGNGSSYTTTLTEDNEGMEVRCVITSSGLTTVSDSAYLGTADTLLITSQPQNHVDETGTYAKFEVEAQGNGLTYVWETSTDGGNTWTTLTTPINDTPYVTDADGIITISSIQTGNYFVQEINDGKDGWEYDLIAKPVTVTADHTATAPANVNFTNNEQTGNGLIVKDTTNGGIKEGWQFKVWTDAAKLGIFTTNENGEIDLGYLQPGTVYVQEIGHESMTEDELRYWSLDNEVKELVIEAGKTGSVTFENRWFGVGQIQKDTTNGGTKAGWQFKVWTDAADLGIFTTDENGEIDLGLLEPGTVYVQEIGHESMTADQLLYWIMDAEIKELVIVAGETRSVTFTNQWVGKGQIIKEMADGTSPVGHKFRVIGPDGVELDGSPFKITSEDGVFSIDGLMPGEYKVIELLPENSIYTPVGGVEQTLTVVAGETASVTFVNALRSGEISGIKVDSSSGAALAGAKFILEWLDNDVWKPVVFSDTIIPGGCSSLNLENGCLTTGEDGLFSFTGLHPDCQYRLREVQAPNGYLLQAASVFEGKLPTDTLSVFREVPNTHTFTYPASGSTEVPRLALATGCLMLLAMLMAAVVLPSSIRKFRIQRTQR